MVEDHVYTVAQEIADVTATRPHVVILGAGASLAAFPDGDKKGLLLPLMTNFVDIVGLKPILDRYGISCKPSDNFEAIYSKLQANGEYQGAVSEIEHAVENYFSRLKLPKTPTLYDHLVLSLRDKDIIATFNWDPFLYNACYRNKGAVKLPQIVYLHGNVAIGYCLKDRQKGVRTGKCSVCGEPFRPTRLLYPIEQKDYNNEPFIVLEWHALQQYLRSASLLTIFGYSAPHSDVEAIELMQQAWGKPEERELEQIEIVDVKDQEELRETWGGFIHTHHYEVHDTFYDTWIAKHPRRSCEAARAQFLEAEFIDENPAPRRLPFEELWEWYRPLAEAEQK